MLIIERAVGHMAMVRSADVFVDGERVGSLRHHERLLVERSPGLHAVHVAIDDAASHQLQVRLFVDHDTHVLVTLFPRLSLRNVLRRRTDAYRFDVTPATDRS